MFKRKLAKAQSTLEYVVLVCVIIAALLLLQTYLKRGVQGKLRTSTDDIGAQFDLGKTAVHSETRHKGEMVQELSGGVTTSYSGQGGKGQADIYKETGTETVETWVEKK